MTNALQNARPSQSDYAYPRSLARPGDHRTRAIGIAACQIDKLDGRYVCRLTPSGQWDADSLRSRYLQLVIDENVRENVRAKTEPVRNLILSLAFGSLASQSQDTP